MIHYLFYFLSFLAIFSALMVVLVKNPVHSVLYLIVTLFSIAGHYVLLNAQFLAAVHVIVYAGAIMVLFLFVLMLLNLNVETESHKSSWLKFMAVLSGGLFLLVLTASVKGSEKIHGVISGGSETGMIKTLGNTLFGEFMLPFEISSLLFLIAMVGAVMLGKKETQ